MRATPRESFTWNAAANVADGRRYPSLTLRALQICSPRYHRPSFAAMGCLGSGLGAFGVFLLPLVDLFQQCIDHLFFQHVPDDLTVAKDHALAVAGRDTDVGFACLAGAVHHAAEYADLHWRLLAGQPLLQLGNDLFEIDGQPAAGGACNQLRLAHAPARCLKNVERCGHLGNRVAEKANANRIANAVEEYWGQAASGFRYRIRRLAGFRHADVRRIIRLLRIKPIRFDDRHHVARFQRHDNVMVTFALGNLEVAQGTINHGRRARVAILHGHFALQAAGIHADAHGYALRLALANYLPVAVVAADVSRVDANLVNGVLKRCQRHLVIEMNIANERHSDAPLD